MKVMRTDRPHISQLITTCARPLLRPSRLPSRSRCARLHSSRWQHQVGRYATNTQASRPGHRPRHPNQSLWRIGRGRATISGHRSSAPPLLSSSLNLGGARPDWPERHRSHFELLGTYHGLYLRMVGPKTRSGRSKWQHGSPAESAMQA